MGKSTLVNRIIGRREAVVEDVPGVTRDRVTYDATWRGRRFTVVDTGGWDPDATGMALRIAEQAQIAAELADVILFVVDATVGVTDADETVGHVLRRSGKPVILAANKVDNQQMELEAAGLWSLGLGEPQPVSALHGRSSGDLLDVILDALPETPPAAFGVERGPRRVALVGKPNVGKSSLLNKLAGEERVLVDPMAGTTRDPVDELIELGGKPWRFVDTAGIRRRDRELQGADFYASMRTRAALERSEVAVVLIDASDVLTEQDLRIISLVIESGRAMVVAFNKWDLVDEDRRYYLEKEIDRQLVRVPWALRVNISAKTGRHVEKLVPAIETRAGLLVHPGPDGPAQRLPHRPGRGHPAPGPRRQAAQDPVRHPGVDGAAQVRAVHLGLPRGDLPPLHRAPDPRGVRLRRLARSRSR